jgi:hypothetical protein
VHVYVVGANTAVGLVGQAVRFPSLSTTSILNATGPSAIDARAGNCLFALAMQSRTTPVLLGVIPVGEVRWNVLLRIENPRV